MNRIKHSRVLPLLLAVLMLLEAFCLPASAAKAEALSLTTDKTVYTYGEDIVVTATGNAQCWVGIYKDGESYGTGSGTVASYFWYYVNKPNDASGRTNGEAVVIQETTSNNRVSVLPAGEYVIYLFDGSGGNEYRVAMSVRIRIQDAALEPLTSIRYDLKNAGDGFANGTVTVTKSAANGATDCVMYWADGNGQPLAGYAPLAKFKLTGETTAFPMYSHTVIPAGARQLIAYAVKDGMLSETAVAAALPAGCDYQPAGTMLGQFQLISDTHLTTDAGASGTVALSNKHFAQFLADVQANAAGSMGIFINGDITNSGLEEEYKKLVSLYEQAKKNGSVPGLHLAMGNHDWIQGNPNNLFQRYAKAVNPDLAVQPEKVYYAETLGGYTFIYLSSEQSGTGATLSSQQLEWLDAQLAEAAQADPGKPVFVLLHQAVYDTVAGTLPDQGWHGVNNEAALKAVLMKYPQVIIAGGHSHWVLDSPRCLYPGDAGMSAALNTASLGYLWSDYDVAGGKYVTGSHGYYVRLYQDRVEVLGREFETGLFLPSAMFVIRRNEIRAEASYTVALGQQLDLGVQTLDGGTVTYASSDAAVAAVSDGGVVTGKKLGTVTVTITALPTETTVVDRKTVTVTVVEGHTCADGNRDHYCDGCGKKLTDHTPGEAVRENEKPATCTAAGSYDEVVYCTVCGGELSRTSKSIEKLAHTPGEAVRENEKPATCTAAGSYDEVVYCTVCGEELSRTAKTVEKLAHTPGAAVRENEKAASCTAAGSYDEVVYCTVCGGELSRTTRTIEKLAHTPGAAVRENEKPASCTAAGSYDEVVYCTVCGEELSRTTKTIEKLAHTPGEAVRENEKPASCTAAGSYDEVVRCTACGEELSRTSGTTAKAPHADKTGDGDHACDSCGLGNITLCADDDGNNFCDECGLVMCVHVDESPRDHVCDKCGRAASVCADTDSDHLCDLCGDKLTEHRDANGDGYCDICGGVRIHADNFPDGNFRNWLLQQTYGEDAFLTAEELGDIQTIDVSEKEIRDLRGIEYFTALSRLNCSDNQLTSLDVSRNVALEWLSCSNNQLTSLDVSNNMALERFSCSDNQLINLDVSHNTRLRELSCSNNQLTTLDVSNNPELFAINCGFNKLTNLDVSQNAKLSNLYCESNQLTNLDLSTNMKLLIKNCSDNAYTITLDTNNQFDLNALPGNFDVTKASNWSGGTVSNNVLTAESKTITYTYHMGCDYMGYAMTETFTLQIDSHIRGAVQIENEITATCEQGGSYDEVIYCTVCGEELSRTTKTIEKLAHTPGAAVRENEKAASCKEPGSYDEVVYCTVCGEELSRTEKPVEKLEHTPGEAVRENEKAASCKEPGSYDEVVYCTGCGEELSRTSKTVEKLAHTPGAAVRENEKAASCKEPGSYDEVVYCTACGGELSRTSKTVEKLAHTPGEAVRENEKAASCTAAGSYDEVVYCTVCGGELSRESKTIDKLDHVDGDSDHKCDLCREVLSECVDGNGDYKCDLCGTELEKPAEPEQAEVIRLAGENRFATAIQVAEEMKTRLGLERFDTVILASGSEFADALAGSYLAAVKEAPILLCWNGDSRFNYLNGEVTAYIKENLAPGGKVYILGGTAAVPESMDLALGRYDVERLAGANRFETNLMILEEAGVGAGAEILVCTATNFADSLSASATGKPILLVFNELGRLYGRQPEYLAGLKNCEFTIIGGENAVSAQLAGEILSYGAASRLAGQNRFETSVLVARKYFEEPDRAVLAYAWNYPDGLCGGALAYAIDVPLILTMTNYEEQAAAYTTEKAITSGIVLGGEGLISEEAVERIFCRNDVNYVLNGGRNHPDNPQMYAAGTNYRLNAPDRDGYIFQGWYLEKNFVNKVETIPAGGGDLTLYARWSLEALNINGQGLDNMIWSWWYYPQVVSTEDAVYWGYATNEGYCGVASYDFQTGETVKNALKVGTAVDDHNGISLTVLDDGRIVCVYAGGHDKDYDMHIRISEKPGDIRNFDTHIVLKSSGKTCYGQILQARGKYYLFYRINNHSWGYRVSADCVSWSDETVLVTSNMQYYCRFVPTTREGIIRICMYSNPSAADPRIRMGFLNLDTGEVLNADCETALGSQQISYDRFRVLIDQPEGMVQRMFDVAVSEPLSPRILFCRFTNKKGTADSTYYLYHTGRILEICKGGAALMDPKYQLGASFVDGDTIAVGRNESGTDYMELYDYSAERVNRVKTLDSRSTQGDNRNARPIVDVNQRVILWHCGYYNPNSYKEFRTCAKLYRLDADMLIEEADRGPDAEALAQVRQENVDAVKSYADRLYRENTQDDYVHADFTWDLANRTSNWIYFTGLMYEAFLETDFDAYNGEIREFFNQHIAEDGKIRGYIVGELDSAMLPAVMLRLLSSGVLTETEEARYAAAAGYVYRQLENQTVYPEAGKLWLHSQKADGEPRPAWVKWNICLDGVYMSQMFMIRLAEAIENGKLEIIDSRGQTVTSEGVWEDVYSRLRFVMEHFRDETSGLLYHGYCVETGETNEAFWSRGIGWYAMVLMEAAEKCPDPEKKAVLVDDFGKLMSALVRWQDFRTFLWYNVTDAKEEYFYQKDTQTIYNMPESSGSAMFAYCLLKGWDRGLLEQETYRTAGLRAFNALVEMKLTEEGLTDIYASSSVTSNKNLYQKNGYITNDGKGVGPLILAGNYV